MHDPARTYDLAEGFGESAVSGFAGLLTFQYSRLFCSDTHAIDAPARLFNLEELRTHLERHWALDGIIRTENLERELIETIADAGIHLSNKQQAWIYRQRRAKRNPSSHDVAARYLTLKLRSWSAGENPLSSSGMAMRGPSDVK